MNTIYKLVAQTLGNDTELFFPTEWAAREYLDDLYGDMEKYVKERRLKPKEMVAKILIYKSNGGPFERHSMVCAKSVFGKED